MFNEIIVIPLFGLDKQTSSKLAEIADSEKVPLMNKNSSKFVTKEEGEDDHSEGKTSNFDDD